MNDAEDVCGCLACAALCGVCCVAAAEEDKRERERAAAEATGRLKNPMIQVNPVAVLTPRSQKAVAAIPGSAAASATGSGSRAAAQPPSNCKAATADQFYYHEHPPAAARQNARKSASYRSNAYLPPSSSR
ncbi:hypothetical protein Gpo141_00002637 [Globisporangium polare]